MKRLFLLFLLGFFTGVFFLSKTPADQNQEVLSSEIQRSHWFLLKRQSNVEYLYFGIPGNKNESELLKTFKVKTGIPGKNPTPLPQLLGRDYWIIVDKEDSSDNPDTAPYFLRLDIPVTEEYPFGPENYLECDGPASHRGEQCNWELPGYFGLHGVGGDMEKLSSSDPGSSGCIRHNDEDISFLYNFLDPKSEEIRYYVEDN